MATHKGSITRIADAAIATRHLMVKVGSDASHIAVAGAADVPLGPCPDTPAAGGETAVNLLGCASETLTMVASGVIAAGAKVFAAASGKVAATGTVRVGTAITAGTANAEIEVDPCLAI